MIYIIGHQGNAIKPQWDGTPHPRWILESKSQIITSVGKGLHKSKPAYTGEVQNSAVTLEYILAVSQTFKHRATLWSRNFTPKYVPKRNENNATQKLYPVVYTSIAY